MFRSLMKSQHHRNPQPVDAQTLLIIHALEINRFILHGFFKNHLKMSYQVDGRQIGLRSLNIPNFAVISFRFVLAFNGCEIVEKKKS